MEVVCPLWVSLSLPLFGFFGGSINSKANLREVLSMIFHSSFLLFLILLKELFRKTHSASPFLPLISHPLVSLKEWVGPRRRKRKDTTQWESYQGRGGKEKHTSFMAAADSRRRKKKKERKKERGTLKDFEWDGMVADKRECLFAAPPLSFLFAKVLTSPLLWS